jgi:predicted transcriptional regulator
MASRRDIRPDAQRLVEQLPESSSWDDLMHEIYVRQAIEAGLADAETNRVLTVEEVRARFGLAR